ncbi:MAG: diaminopimelate decarboxylase [Gemmatimonadota bacterium]
MPTFDYRGDVLHCEDASLEALAAEFETPLYVYSRAGLLERYRAFDAAFEPLDRLIAYSVKANGNLSVLRLLARQGAGADIVSGGELHRARLAGIPAERIVFSGTGKTADELDAALAAGILAFNVESEGELHLLAHRAAAAGRVAPVALRVNPDILSPTPHPYTRTGHRQTKFGVPAEDARRLFRVAVEHPSLAPVGIDAHIGSEIAAPEPYQQALLFLLDLVDDLRRDGIALAHVDLGGGYDACPDEDVAATVEALAERVVPHLATSDLRLVLEPGRFIVAETGVLLTRVLYVKEMGEKTFVVVDAGMNDFLRPSHYDAQHEVQPVRRTDNAPASVDVVGPVCETGDFLALGRELPLPQPGDLLVVRVTGAYGFSMASSYNSRPRPAEVLVQGADAQLVRRREDYDDLVRGEVELLARDG